MSFDHSIDLIHQHKMDKIEVPLSKTKNILTLVGCFAFIIVGIFFILKPATFISPFIGSILFIQIAGTASILFFGIVAVYGFRKLLDRKAGLIIDINGIYDNSNALSIGLIKWDDIINVKVSQISSSRFLLIYVKNPNDYMNRTKGLKKKMMEANVKIYGTPLSITSNTLKCNFNVLEKMINDRL